MTSETIAFRVPSDQMRSLRKLAKTQERTVSDIVRTFLPRPHEADALAVSEQFRQRITTTK